jgi:hypothetical protein
MNEPQTQTNTTPDTASTAEQPLKTWVAPSFERTPLNEAMASHASASSLDGQANYS